MRSLDHLLILRVEHLADVPQLHGLILAVGDEVVPVSLSRDARYARLVTAQTSHLMQFWRRVFVCVCVRGGVINLHTLGKRKTAGGIRDVFWGGFIRQEAQHL